MAISFIACATFILLSRVRSIAIASHFVRQSLNIKFFFSHAASNQLSLINQCTCLGFTQTYECTIVAEGGATIWKGSAINCTEIDGEIILSHSSAQTRGCFDSSITAYGDRIEDNHYVSRLNIMNLSSNMINKSVQCIYSNGISTDTVVGTDYIEITTGTQ